MKRVSLYLSMLLAAVFSLSAVTPVKTSTADDPIWYTIANPRYNGGQINEVGGALTKTAGFTTGSFWRFETVGDEAPNAVYIINYETGDYLYHPNSGNAANVSVTSTPSSSNYWYLIEQPNWGVTGWIISVVGSNTGTACLDASNAGAVFSGGWHASSGDYEGTTWTITEVSNDAAKESFFSNFVALKQPVLFGEAGVAQIKESVEAKFQVYDNPVETYVNMAAGLAEARTVYNSLWPQVLKANANGKSFSFYMPVVARNAGYLVPTANGANLTTSGSYSASAIWTMTVNDDNTVAIQNLPTSKYAVAQTTSTNWTLGDTPSALSLYLFDLENTITFGKVNPATQEYMHKGSGNVVGWGTAADASKWIVAEADLQPIVDEANAQITGALANKDAIIAALTATGLWSADELKEFVDALDEITPLNVDDYETPAEIAQAVDAKLAAVNEAFALVSAKTFAVYNIGCGLTDNAPAYLSLADGNVANTVYAPTAKAQWRFEVVNGQLVLAEKNINAITYLAALNGSDFSTAAGAANALPINIAASTAADKIANQITISTAAGALSANGGNLTTGDASSANAQWVLVEITNAIYTLPGSTAAIEDLNFVIGSFNRGGYFTTDIIMPGAAVQHAAEGPYSFWKLVPTGNENGYYIKSAAATFYVGSAFTITDTPTEWFILPNGVNTYGMALSKTNPISGSSCADAHNYDNGIGTWSPSAGDWQGTTWVVAAVSDGTVEDALDGVNPAEGVSSLAAKVVANLAALPNIYSQEAVDQMVEQINAATNNENLTADERIAAIGNLMEEAVSAVCEKPFMLANVRRMNRAINNEASVGINTLSYIAINNGTTLQMSLETPGATADNVTPKRENISIFKFENAGSGKVKISGLNAGPYYIYNNSTEDQASFGLVNSLEVATPQGMNVNLLANTTITTYNANDAGSRWVMIDPFKPFDVPVKGAEHYAVFTSYNRGGVLTAQTALGVNPATAPIQHTDLTLGSFWAVAPGEKEGYYTLKNALNGLYLASNNSYSETPVEWYIAPNAGNPEAGLSLAVAPEGQCLDASNAGAGINLWKPSAGDWKGTTWIVASYSGNVANMAAQNFCANANLNAVKEDLNRVIATTPWGVSALSQGVAECETFKGGADFDGDYIAAAKYVMNIKNEVSDNYFAAAAAEADGSKVLLQSLRRANAGLSTNTLTVSTEGSNVPMLGLGESFDNPSSTWYVEASEDEGYFTLHTENGYYLGNVPGVSQQVLVSEDPADAAKFYFWPIFLGNENSGIAMIDQKNGLALNVNQQPTAYLVGYYAQDGGSTWKIISTSPTTGIDNVELGNETININDADVELYNLQGIRVKVADAAPGIYVARKAGVVVKVRKF